MPTPKTDNPDKPSIHLSISSNGGNVRDGGAIYNVLTEQEPNVYLALSPTMSPLYSSEDGAIAKGLSPTVRLATLGPPEALAKGLGSVRLDPDIRLVASQVGENTGGENLVRNLTGDHGPDGRLAHKINYQGDDTLSAGDPTGQNRVPALLVSFVYLEPFLANRHLYHYRDWVLDSGAFSAHMSGTEINLQEYIDCCKKLLAEDKTLSAVFSLDVIGDWRASLTNTEEMWRQGVPAIPCFHTREPWDILIGMAKDYPRIALGGLVGIGKSEQNEWIGQCFARVWPKKIHGFGMCSEKLLMSFPFHSVDATNWELGPCKYGQWKSFGGDRVSVRGSHQNLRCEVEWYLDLEDRVRRRWKKEMALLESLKAPAVHSAGGGSDTCYKEGGAVAKALKEPE